MGKRTDYVALRQGFGLARGLSDEFIQACERINPPIEAIHRLVTPNGRETMDEVVRRAVADWQAEQPKPVEPSTHSGHPYRNGGQKTNDIIWVGEVEVDYGTRPSYEELNGVWFDWVHERFGNTTPELRDLIAKPLPTSGIVKRRVGYLHLNRNATDEQVLAEIAKRRVVPVTDLELMYSGRIFPRMGREFPVVALRSFFRIDRNLISVVLYGNGCRRGLRLVFDSVDDPWRGDYRFLVREDGE